MKTTIKAHAGAQIVLTPNVEGISMNCMAAVITTSGLELQSVAIILTPDQFGALIFGGEMALETRHYKQVRGAA